MEITGKMVPSGQDPWKIPQKIVENRQDPAEPEGIYYYFRAEGFSLTLVVSLFHSPSMASDQGEREQAHPVLREKLRVSVNVSGCFQCFLGVSQKSWLNHPASNQRRQL